jgi:malonyl-CoA/methylmalonyl-CoA synthetase
MALALPLFHVHGLGLGVHGALLHGMTLLLFERFEAGRIVEAFERQGATLFQGVPTMYVKLLELLERSPQAPSALARGRLFTAGSASLPADDFQRFEELTGHRILERYGMSETLFTLSNPYEDRRPGTVGLPVPGCEVRIVDEEGREAGPDEPGEILVTSNGMMTRYWGRPDETRDSFRDGWFATGDIARRSRDGYVTIAGRKSVDFIKSGGFKISAREIEDVLRRHPRVRDVAVVGAPDRVWGERIVAAVVLRPAAGPSPSPEALLEELSSFCGRSLADYKRPREVRVVEELPRNALGKVQKHKIRDALA